jgi:hypothetical protein
MISYHPFNANTNNSDLRFTAIVETPLNLSFLRSRLKTCDLYNILMVVWIQKVVKNAVKSHPCKV